MGDDFKAAFGSVLSLVATRIELLALELERERDQVLRQFRLASMFVIAGGVGGIAAIAWSNAALMSPYREWALGGIAVLFAGVALASSWNLRNANERASPLLSSVVRQLRLDRVALDQVRGGVSGQVQRTPEAA